MHMEALDVVLRFSPSSGLKNVCLASLRIYTLTWILISGACSSEITGFLGEDVLLPCVVTYEDEFILQGFVIHWQRENYTEVHSFYYGKDHPEYQEEGFHGRTQLFPQEFPRGNLSLLLKRVRPSDAGKYKCYVFLNDAYEHKTIWTELVVHDKPTHPFQPGDKVVVKPLPAKGGTTEPPYGLPTTILAVTHTAVLTEESSTWIHASRIKSTKE
ncbi:CD276 antigen homolog isoform X2 [Ascaphus truei]|uniref:CD276 antigen homolog isoform X2 n=1 Tax=Ascaphus truei TaxID=8439 RepID=UPI003F5AB5DA